WASNDYASVSKVNTGFAGTLMGLESFVLIAVSAALGIFYAYGLLQVVMASLPRILSGVFGTAVGSIAMSTKLLVSTIVLIIEIIGTMLLYQVFDSLLLGIIRGLDGIMPLKSGLG